MYLTQYSPIDLLLPFPIKQSLARSVSVYNNKVTLVSLYMKFKVHADLWFAIIQTTHAQRAIYGMYCFTIGWIL